MNTSTEINLESSLLGFASLSKDVMYVKNYNIIMRKDDSKDRVKIISGGGAGHEPGENAFVGDGMLWASVSGNIFASPSVTSCLAAILMAKNPDSEILLIINNYTGDRLNFGLAHTLARTKYNYNNIKMITVDDDCSIDNPRQSTGRRGLAGILLINKIAGAMSSMNKGLHEIHQLCSDLLSNRMIRTIGFSFSHDGQNCLKNVEIGYGIHGEPGSLHFDKEMNFKRIIDIMITKLNLINVQSDVILLFNDLGGTSAYILSHFVHDFIALIAELPFKVIKVYVGSFLSSLGKEALSVTVMEVKNPKILDYLTYPVRVPAGHLFNDPFEICEPTIVDYEIPETEIDLIIPGSVSDDEIIIVQNSIKTACRVSMNMKQLLNDIDGILGDGDTGTTLGRGAEKLLQVLTNGNLCINNPHMMLQQIGNILMASMGGTSGVIFSIFLQCASSAFTESNQHSIKNWLKAIALGIDGIMQYGKAEIGDRTLLDALKVGYNELIDYTVKNEKLDLLSALSSFSNGCQKGCEATKNMRPMSGRAAYSVTDENADYKFQSIHPDPGALAIASIVQEIYKELLNGSQ